MCIRLPRERYFEVGRSGVGDVVELGWGAWGSSLWLVEHAVYYSAPYPPREWVGGYRAARPEWIRALVEANPGGVSDETYRLWTGRKRPGVS